MRGESEMRARSVLLSLLLLLHSNNNGNFLVGASASTLQSQSQSQPPPPRNFKSNNYIRADFPTDFVFGAGSSAYQIEGAVDEDGRSPSIWDIFTHQGWMLDKSNADITADFYHKYQEDVQVMGEMGLEAYRFSISWSRLIPNGRGAINPKGLEFYNNLIDGLVQKGIEVHVSLYHLDLPQCLQDEYGGWLSPRIVDDFTAYAEVCFREFGDRVSHWTTVVEPNALAVASYDSGAFPPMHCSKPFCFHNNISSTLGNSTVEPYIVLHNALLAHASVAKLYRQNYKAVQKGRVGINVYTFWSYPFSNSVPDIKAAQRARDFSYGWVINPLVFGEYPVTMRANVGSRLPNFTQSQSDLVKGSADFIGINHYTSCYVSDNSNAHMTALPDFNADMNVLFRMSRNDSPTNAFIPINMGSDPNGLQLMLEYLRDFYGNIPVYIQENGLQEPAESTVYDAKRVEYISSYIGSTLAALRNGANVKGYFVWALMDVFEFLSGYQTRYGLYYVDFKDKNRPRQPKMSAHWYSNFLKGKNAINLDQNIQKDVTLYHKE